MRVKFIKKTKDIREGATKSYSPSSVIAIDRKLGEAYVKNGDAVEVDAIGNNLKVKVNKKNIEEDGKV